MRVHSNETGVTLLEMLVVVAVLSLLLGGIYGLLTSAYQTYNHNRAKLESQQIARTVLDYLVYRLREIDSGKITRDATNCTYCHTPNMDDSSVDDSDIPCAIDVTIPQQAPAILDIQTTSLSTLSGVPTEYQTMDGNYIQFHADLLPLHGFNESFTDDDGDGTWDWTAGNASQGDLDADSEYDLGEPELLEDMNDNSAYDYFGERWTMELQDSSDGPFYELVESVSFSTLSPDISKYNKSIYPDTGYSKIPVAYGITGLTIKEVPRVSSPYPTASGESVDASCRGGSATACHGSAGSGGAVNVYGDADSMDYSKFIATHPWWNIGGLSVEVTASNTRANKQEFTTLRQFVILRNLEVNQ